MDRNWVTKVSILRNIQSYILALGLFYAAIIFLPFLSNSYILPKLGILYITASLLIFIEAVITLIAHKNYCFYKSDLVIAVLLITHSINYAFSVNRIISFYGMYQQEGLGYISVLCYCMFGFIYARLPKGKNTLILVFFIAASTLSSLYSILLFSKVNPRPDGLEGQPILSSLIIAIGILSAASLWNEKYRWYIKIIIICAVLIHSLALFILQSSTVIFSLISTLLILVVLKLYTTKTKKIKLIFITLLCTFLLLLLYFIPKKSFSVSQRSLEYSSAIKMLRSVKNLGRIIVGYGQNTSGYGYKIYRNPALNLTKERNWDLSKIRNHYMEIIYTQGLIGIIFWLGLIIFSLRKRHNPFSYMFYFLILWQLFYYLTPLTYIFYLFGLVNSYNRNYTLVYTIFLKRALLCITLLLLGIYYIYTAITFLVADFESHRGHINQAIAIFPYNSEYYYQETYAYYDRIFHYRLNHSCISRHTCTSLYLLSQYNQAHQSAERTTSRNPNESRYWDLRGTLLFFHALDTPKEHDQLLRKALQFHRFAFYLDPTNYNIADNIGSIYMEMKDYQRAAYFFRKSLYLYPDYLPAKNHLAEILR